MALPAHQTKHLPLLRYPILDIELTLAQSDDGHSTGTALWLGAQCLTAFLADALPKPKHPAGRRRRAIELGSGIGLSALALAAQGWSVLATDLPPVVSSVLAPNIARNSPLLRRPNAQGHNHGQVQVRALDWTTSPETWTWTDAVCISPVSASDADAGANTISSTAEPGGSETSAPASDDELLGPPFDLILTADTIYAPALIDPLLRTLRHLALLSPLTPASSTTQGPSPSPHPSQNRKHTHAHAHAHAPIYLALESRDPSLIAAFFTAARTSYGFARTTRVPAPRLRRAMARAGLGGWKPEEWEGVEVWRMELRMEPEMKVGDKEGNECMQVYARRRPMDGFVDKDAEDSLLI